MRQMAAPIIPRFMVSPEIALSWMRSSFSVDPERGSLTWVSPPKNHPRMIGLDAGSQRPNKCGKLYVCVKFNKTVIKRAHLIFLWVHKRFPAPVIDHVNGDSTDDRICNLREATVMQNAWNHKKRKKKQTLPMGVRTVPSGKFQARLCVNKRMLHLGCFMTADEASSVYQSARKQHYGDFA